MLKHFLSTQDGEKIGLWKEWYNTEEKMYELSYKDGEKDGLWIRWRDNGRKWREETWKDDELISKNCC